ncbi:MAG: DUF6894 family protein [Caulobacteraceae bacterium]
MSRYFFDVIGDDYRIEDPEGEELSGLDAVKKEALAGARELLSQAVEAGWSVDRRHIQVRDASGRVVFKSPMIAALGPSLRG